uniref:Akirin n=1 Tax=Setaria digitata TaxID=48799 RepID=A0A915PMV7_9BILA
MACGVALKRPYDYDDYLIAEGSEVKRARHTQTHCSPFRAQIGTIAASLPISGPSNALLQLRDPKERDDNSPFAQVGNNLQLSSGQLESYLRAEVRYLKRRHLIPHRTLTSSVVNANDGDESGAAKRYGPHFSCNLSSGNGGNSQHGYREAPLSPNNNSGSESEGEANIQKTSAMKDLYEKPQFSLKQVMMICERLLKQQEVRLRYEYETVLNQRLEEQHEQYVQFAREQIERQHQDDGVELSYLS